MKKILAIVCSFALFLSLGMAALAANTGNKGNQSDTISPASYPLHQGNRDNWDNAIDWLGYREGDAFGLNAAKGETTQVPGYTMDGEGIFWHFVNPDKLGGYANITFVNEAGETLAFNNVKPYKNDQHFGVVTASGWKLLKVEYFPGSMPKKGATQFNLSHTSGKLEEDPPTEPYGTFAIAVQKQLTDKAAELCKWKELFPTFKFTLVLTVDGQEVLNDTQSVTMDADGMFDPIFWQEDLAQYFSDTVKSVTVAWTITEEAVYGFTSVTETIVGSMVVNDGDDAVANEGQPFDWLNDLTYKTLNGGTGTAAAFRLDGTYVAKGNAWHKVSIEQGKFQIILGQNTVIGYGETLADGTVNYTIFGTVAGTFDYHYAFWGNAQELADLSPGSLKDYPKTPASVDDYVRIHWGGITVTEIAVLLG